MQKVHLITFSAGSEEYRAAGKRLASQAKKLSLVSVVKYFSEDDLDKDYYKIFHNFPTRFKKGFGLWSWKPYVIKKYMALMEDDDILIYIDSGCEINSRGAYRLQEYIDLANKHDALFFQLPHKHWEWTKFNNNLLGSLSDRNRAQIVATCFLLKKSSVVEALVDRWLAMCSQNDGQLLKDPDEHERQLSIFKGHRHDQSCLTRCLFEEGFHIIPDETWNRNLKSLKNKPFIAIRNRTGVSKLYKIESFPRNIFLGIRRVFARFNAS